MEIALIIVSCICTVVIPFAISLAVDNKNRRKRERAKDEISNYVFGQIDMLLNKEIKITPDFKENLEKSYIAYHKWDITPREEMRPKKEGK